MATFGTLSLGMLFLAFVYISVAGAQCRGDDATLSICNGLRSDPNEALIIGIVGAVLFGLLAGCFAFQLCCGDDVDDKEMWVPATFGICGLLMFVVGTPMLLITLFSYSFVPDIANDWCEARCNITDQIAQTMKGGCDGRIEHRAYGDVCVARKGTGDTGTYSEDQCRDIYQVTISDLADSDACRSVDARRLQGAAAVAHANQWVPCFGGGNPRQVTAVNLRQQFQGGENTTYPCIVPPGDVVEAFGDKGEWTNLRLSVDFALLGYCYSPGRVGETCHDRYVNLVDQYRFTLHASIGLVAAAVLICLVQWTMPCLRCAFRCLWKKSDGGSMDYRRLAYSDREEEDCRDGSCCCMAIFSLTCCCCPRSVKETDGVWLPPNQRDW